LAEGGRGEGRGEVLQRRFSGLDGVSAWGAGLGGDRAGGVVPVSGSSNGPFGPSGGPGVGPPKDWGPRGGTPMWKRD